MTKNQTKKEDDLRIVSSSVFVFDELKLKGKDLCWYLKMTLKTRLPQSFREYDIEISLNQEPYKQRIADFEKRKLESEANFQENLFGKDALKSQLKEIDNEIKEVEEELKRDLEDSAKIFFNGILEKLEYKDSDTQVTLLIPYDVVSQFNDIKGLLKNYKIDLIRE